MQTGHPYAVQTMEDATAPLIVSQPLPATARMTQINQKWYLVDIINSGVYRIADRWYVANLLAPWESATHRTATTRALDAGFLQLGISLRQWCIWLSLVLLLCERALTWWTRRVT
jgi:hypothetical protein